MYKNHKKLVLTNSMHVFGERSQASIFTVYVYGLGVLCISISRGASQMLHVTDFRGYHFFSR